MAKLIMRAYSFPPLRREDLERLGIIEAQISEVEAILPGCAALLAVRPTLTEMRDQLGELIAGLGAVRRVLNAGTNFTSEALNRWQQAAHAFGHPFGSDLEFAANLDLDTLIAAAIEAKNGLGTEQRRSRIAEDAEPIRRIADALVIGWAKGHADQEFTPQYSMAASVFREVVQFAYEAMDAPECYVPERTLRAYRAWCRKDAARRAAERQTIGMFASAEQFDNERYSQAAGKTTRRRYMRLAKN
jgi:hypothetical protein